MFRFVHRLWMCWNRGGTVSKLGKRFEEALLFSARAHREQRRKGSEMPYVAHLLAVAAIVIENGGDEDEAIAALLHDVMEDQGVSREEIERRFGERVARIVEGCTDGVPDPQTGEKPEWRIRKEAYLLHLEVASPSEVLVSSADKLHNARSILSDYRKLGEGVWARFRGGRDGTLWYYRALADRFRAVSDSAVVDELWRVVSEMEMLAARESPV